MNSLILEKVDNLVNYIKESKEYQDYLFLSMKLSKNKKALGYIERIKILQKDIVKKEMYKEDITSLEKEINDLLEELNKIPLYVEFTNKQMELNEIFQNIKDTLNEYFYKVFN